MELSVQPASATLNLHECSIRREGLRTVRCKVMDMKTSNKKYTTIIYMRLQKRSHD